MAELDDGEASARPRLEYVSDDCDEDVWLSPHSREFFEDLWLRPRGASDSCVMSEGSVKSISKSSSIGSWD